MAIVRSSELLSVADAEPSSAPTALSSTLSAPRHGADLAAASRRYGIALDAWLDVSTGINPCAYPPAIIDPALFQHLPLGDEDLCSAARAYCDAPVTPVAAGGSQALIQWLPLLAKKLAAEKLLAADKHGRCRVAVPSIGYSEHAFRWLWADHQIIYYDPRQPAAIDDLLRQHAVDVLIVINAHNPLGTLIEPAQLLVWHDRLAQRGGWLIVDEAFIDPTPH